MKLRDLDATFLRIADEGGVEQNQMDVSLEEAHGIMFLCPKCFAENGGSVGTHSVICWFAGRGVPDERTPGPGRWNPEGTGLDDLTFVGPGAVSVLLTSGCRWHGFVSRGEAT